MPHLPKSPKIWYNMRPEFCLCQPTRVAARLHQRHEFIVLGSLKFDLSSSNLAEKALEPRSPALTWTIVAYYKHSAAERRGRWRSTHWVQPDRFYFGLCLLESRGCRSF